MTRVEYLEQFKSLYKKKYGLDLSQEETTKYATDLLNLMQVLTKKDKPKTVENNLEGGIDETIKI